MLKNKAKKGPVSTKASSRGGFTLIEILVVIAIIAILAAIVLVAINPAKRFRDARNSQRKANVESILSALQQNMVDNKGILTGCDTIPTTEATADVISDSDVDLAPCLSKYLARLPVDPTTGSWIDSDDYNTEYTIWQDTDSQQITIAAPESTEPSEGEDIVISVTR